jgi:DNA polymerase I-like protein with 3'-5' exonuclease and polymerase domains
MFLQQVDDKINTERSWMSAYRFHLVTSIQQLSKLIDFCIERKLYSIDVETTGLDNRVYPDSFFDDGKTTRHGIRTVDKIAGVCMSFNGEDGYYIPLSHEPEGSNNLPWDPAWDEFERLVYSDARAITHGGIFDDEFLYPVTGKEYWKKEEFEDTFLISKILNPLKGSPNGLKPLTKEHFGVDMIELDELFTDEMKVYLKKQGMGLNFAMLHPREGLEYGCSDGIFTYKLFHTLREKLAPGDLFIYELEKSFSNVLRKLERNRVHLDIDRLHQLEVECKTEMRKVGDAIRTFIESRNKHNKGKWSTLNIGSVDQLAEALITHEDGLLLKPTKELIVEAAGGWSNYNEGGGDDDSDQSESSGEKKYTLKETAIKSLHDAYGKKTLIKIDDRENSLFELILEYRHYSKMLDSYLAPLSSSFDKYGDVRPSFTQMGTDTARLSAKAGEIKDGYSGINFQGIPRDSDEDKPELFKQIRTIIVPREGWMLAKLDYAGEELRVVTNLSGDRVWTKSFLYEDGDVHSITARILFGKDEVNKDERNRGKRSNFAFIYGGGAGAIQRNVECTMEDAQRHMDNLRHGVPELMGYVDHQKQFAKKFKCIYTSFGRRIPISDIDSPIRKLRSAAERRAINYTVQSTSADIIKMAMCFVDKNIRKLGWEDRVKYILTVHDEIVFEIRPQYLMEIIPKLNEWMTCIWQIPKVHGREWVVPLLTEPGIDTNWRAKYDHFEMTQGVPAKSSDIAEDGTFKGKLKKNHYFADGRIYQEVPDFLKPHITRLPINGKELPVIESVPLLEAKSEEKPVTEEPVSMSEDKEITELASLSLNSGDLDLSDLNVSMNSDNDIIPIENTSSEGGLEDLVALPDKPETELNLEETVNKTEIDPKSVLRWMIRSQLNETTIRKLHAVCILAEGETPLRVISPEGEILIHEDIGAKIDQESFLQYARLFGLG